MAFDSFSPVQRRVIRHAVGDFTSCLAAGAIRSGKSASSSVGFALWVLEDGVGFDHCLLGQSVESVMRNVGFSLIETFRSLGVPAHLSKDFGTRIIVPFRTAETSIWVIGADNERGARRIQGATFKGLFVDEAVIIPQSVFMMAWGRLSVEGSKMWATYNREGPRHWFKRHVEDRVHEYNGVVHDFFMHDNPSLTKATLERYDRSYYGHFHDRMIKGQWAGASGLIFPKWLEPGQGVDPGKRPATIVLTMDWGQSGVLAAFAVRERGRCAEFQSELYHDANADGEWDIQQAADYLADFAKRNSASWPCIIWLDPATPARLKRLLKNRSFSVRNADNTVISGIVTTRHRLETGEITIGNVPKLKEELESYRWDPNRADQGVDMPLKERDHGCDALRYYAHSTGKAFRYMKPIRTADIGM